jgi:hypothetical protein
VLEALEMADNYSMKDYIFDHGCHYKCWVWLSKAKKHFEIVKGTLKANIVKVSIELCA